MNGKITAKKWILPVAILLILLVLLSGIWLGIQINKFITREVTTDIDLQAGSSAVSSATQPAGEDPAAAAPQATNPQGSGETSGSTSGTSGSAQNASSGGHTGTAVTYVPNPGFTVGEGTGSTKITLFRSAYTNEAGDQVAASSLGDKVVAPGTVNSHKVHIRNTGNCALDYTLKISDLFPNAPQDRTVPLEVRICDYRGTYIVGSADTWVPLQEMKNAEHSGVVGSGSYVYYTVEWRWPYETGSDENLYDTMLGNVNTSFVECGIELTASAEESADPYAVGGISIPNTGDTAKLTLWTGSFVISFFLIVLLLLLAPRRKREEDVK